MMRILLVDDEPLALERLSFALRAIPDVEIVGTASDGFQARDQIAALEPDLAILDIQMPGLSGIDLAQSLSESARPPEIMFVTAFNRFALDAFSVEAVDYLLKPVSFDRLRIGIERVRRRLRMLDAEGRAAELATIVTELRADGETQAQPVRGAYDSGIWVPGRQGSVRVPIDSIDRIEAARDYVLLNTPYKSYIMRAKMNEIEQRIDPSVIVRVHRSHMVRIAAVTGVERPGKGLLRLLLNDGTRLQVGPNYQDQVVQRLGL
ncbi:LytTR family DNA-binding domain-containing protein [Sphingomonas sp. HITSZ_GF]|uniref:LytR/AlgR family response regulator transcription factor n=1 Tax=Sphingomonas sp. HITSZ_GF TaxID=3037247 RepID=UPI00240E8F65|nr:LytTR family DNA-binding domain-containing protein [Sphingomonas sp. HITSZ_GF]MDG2534222.1 LytTR family DNA-binding domain-containing protein [Sphingomonas sp. HITSZ_GF]